MEQIITTSLPKTIFPEIREPETQYISATVRSFLVAAVIAPPAGQQNSSFFVKRSRRPSIILCNMPPELVPIIFNNSIQLSTAGMGLRQYTAQSPIQSTTISTSHQHKELTCWVMKLNGPTSKCNVRTICESTDRLN